MLLVGVRSHQLAYLRFAIILRCRNRDTNESYERYFLSHGKDTESDFFVYPQAIPASGLLVIRWLETDGLRLGHITLTLDWRGTPLHGRSWPLLGRVAVLVLPTHVSPEDCTTHGNVNIPMRWTAARWYPGA